mmetsp:Transcript_33809/g.48057  ORF Transcript_33809/g.48057 Transcript_33809/m.48057 type:complete len:112 (+) Transcript_33809:92-427(+)
MASKTVTLKPSPQIEQGGLPGAASPLSMRSSKRGIGISDGILPGTGYAVGVETAGVTVVVSSVMGAIVVFNNATGAVVMLIGMFGAMVVFVGAAGAVVVVFVGVTGAVVEV